MNFFKEIFSLYKFFKLKESEKEIVIYSEHEGYYPVYEGVLKDLTLYKNVLYITSDANDPIFQLELKNLNVIYLHLFFTAIANYIKCKVFLMTTPDLNSFHLKRSIFPTHYLYIFHSMVSTHMMYLEGAFDHFDSILCVGKYQIKEIREREKKLGLKPKILIEAGYHRLQRILENHHPVTNKKTTILIAPSWGENNILKSYGEDLIGVLLSANYKVIVRPHPEIIRRNKEVVSSIHKKFSDNEDFELEISVRNDNSLHSADLMICDCSGVALEYAFGTERPVLFLDLPVKVKNNNYKNVSLHPIELSLREKIGKLIHVDNKNLQPILGDIKYLIDNGSLYKNKIINLREELICNKDSSINASDYILKLLDNSEVQESELSCSRN